ncbi:hypothetical protein AZI86_06035 [Bdellovibrio bacteriovorus]|uniref:Peptidase S74 domain-containing protein n=1 Tax=Bdellovibrio bacteriovorus TaxID=959 RepID=A0A150WQ42_BDEBC|nr:tail fiber domain-containing protein [Bdellovibrio bacteriovorus]KYG66602.1 hypothetical protein AZI86_06035 [Bdellovibrio bacteriovorus]
MLGRLKVPFILTFFSMLLSSCSDINPEVSCIASCNEAKTFEYSQHDGSLNFKGIFMQNSEVHLFEDGVEVPVQSTFGTNTLKIVPIANAPHQLKPSSIYKVLVMNANANGTSTFTLPASTSATTLSGDVTGDISNNSVQRIRGVPISATAPTSGGFLKYDGTSWSSSAISTADITGLSTSLNSLSTNISSKLSLSQFPSSCSANSTLTFSSPTGNFLCTNIAITDSQVTYSSQTARTFLAAPSTANGAPTFRVLTAADLPSGLTSSQWTTTGSNISYITGSVGIGTTNPSATLDVTGASAFAGRINSTPVSPNYTAEISVGFEDANKQGLRIISLGSASSNPFRSIIYGNSNGTPSAGGYIDFDTPTNTMRIRPSGSSGAISIVNSSDVERIRMMPAAPDNGEMMTVVGAIRSYAFNYSSDARYKRNISSVENSLDKLSMIRGVTYDWRQDEFPEKHFSTRRQIGLIAQEVEKQFPEAVSTDEKGYKSVGYATLVAPIIEALKELHSNKVEKVEFDKLKKENEELKARLDRLEKALDKKN